MEYYVENIFKTEDENLIKEKIIKISKEIIIKTIEEKNDD